MKNIKVLVIMVGLLLTASAVGAVNYPTYKPTTRQAVVSMPSYQASQPSSNSTSLTPMLGSDGTAVTPYTEEPSTGAPGRAAAGPRKDPIFDGGGTTGGGGGEGAPEPGSPIGSVWGLLLMAAGYVLVKLINQKNMVKKLMTMLVLLSMTSTLLAVPAKRGFITMTQPDGTTIEVELRGDEFYHYAVNRAGEVVEQDANGYWKVVENSISGEQIRARRNQSPIWQSKYAQKTQGPNRVAGYNRGGSLPTKGLVILVNFQDVKFQSGNTLVEMSAMMNGTNYTYDGATGSAKEYFRAQSNGQYVPEFEVVGPVTVSQNQAYYGSGNGAGKDKAAEMVMEACKLVENQVDFTQYEKGSTGKVDFVYVIYAGHQENEGGGVNTIWAHNWNVASAYSAGRSSKNPSLDANKVDGLQIGDYACSSELSGASGTTRSGIGTFVHEFSHVLGLPDLYDTDGTTNGNAAGLDPGKWSPLAYGNYLNNGKTPCNYSIYDKYYLGWVTPTCLNADGSYSLNAGEGYQINNTGELKPWNYSNQWAYYVENRQKTGWDAYIPASGMLLWKVNYLSGNWVKNLVNAFSAGVRCSIIPADGTITDRGDAGDVYTTGEKQVISGYNLTNIAMADGKVSFCLNSCAARFTVRWMVNGVVFASKSDYESGAPLVMPGTPDACSENRVFKGWTAQANYLDPFNAPEDLFTEAGEKTVTEDVTYYAVFGAK